MVVSHENKILIHIYNIYMWLPESIEINFKYSMSGIIENNWCCLSESCIFHTIRSEI